MIMTLQGDQKSNLRHVSVSGFEKEKRHYSEEDELFQDIFEIRFRFCRVEKSCSDSPDLLTANHVTNSF